MQHVCLKNYFKTLKLSIQTDADEAEEEQEPENIVNVEIPKIKTDLGKEIHFVKLPNFLSVEPK